jgi:chromodomain-helicase-DNA-binding protein 1
MANQRRVYVAGFWPLDPSPPGTQLENMYKKILRNQAEEAQAKKASGVPAPAATNGTSGSSTTVVKG